jgi:predicted nucleotide-binding protein
MWSRWRDVTQRALESLFTSGEPSGEFHSASRPTMVISSTPAQEFAWEREATGDGVNKLRSFIEQLEFIDAPQDSQFAASKQAAATPKPPTANSQVFLVHGRDDARKTEVARVLERTGPHPVTILHEQPNTGRTIIEKFEDYASTADYAVILCTGDDVGGLAPRSDDPDPDLQPRARQNVIFEYGFFVGRLGRGRVVVLYAAGVELPSNTGGVAFIGLSGESWKFELLRELRAAGFDHDLNKL